MTSLPSQIANLTMKSVQSFVLPELDFVSNTLCIFLAKILTDEWKLDEFPNYLLASFPKQMAKEWKIKASWWITRDLQLPGDFFSSEINTVVSWDIRIITRYNVYVIVTIIAYVISPSSVEFVISYRISISHRKFVRNFYIANLGNNYDQKWYNIYGKFSNIFFSF